jgi:ATP-binding cassette subfamily B protein
MMVLICASILVIYVAKGFAAYGQEILLARIGNNIIARTQRKIFNAILLQDLPFFQANGSADLVTRITHNAQAASTALNLIATSLGRDLLTLISLVIVMILQDPILTLIALIIVPAFFTVITRLLKQVKKLFSSEVRSLATIISTIQETIHGIKVIKAFRLEDTMRDRMNDSVMAVERLSNRMVAVQAGTNPLIDTLGGIAVSGVIFYGGWRVIYNGATPGEFFAFITALLMMTDPARRLARLHLQLAANSVGVKMLYDLVDMLPDAEARHDRLRPIAITRGELQLHDVTFGYDPEKPVLKSINLLADAEKITALVGLSGSGKSSLFNLILRFWQPQKGRITFDGQDIQNADPESLYDSISYVGQDVFLFEGTIAENILRGRPGATEADMIEAAKNAAAHDFIMSLPQGYDTRVGEFGGQLSGGQRQRVSIARAFLKDAKVVLLDEPTSALDAESDAAIQGALQRLVHGRTTLIIAHRLATIANADKIVVLDHGEIVETGTHADLIARNGQYARLYQLQFASAD